MKLKTKQKFTLLTLCLVFALLFGAFPMNIFFQNKAFANSFESVSISNSNFNTNPTSLYIETVPTGWSKTQTNAVGLFGTINTGENKFNKSTYKLSENPQTMSLDSADTKVLMLNARVATADDKISVDKTKTSQGYKSNEITLEANSYYKMVILAKTEVGAFGSIYLSGLSTEGANLQAQIERFQTHYSWKEYSLFISTGTQKETVNLELWLGTQGGTTSPYAVFYDNISLLKLSQANYKNQNPQITENTKVVELEKTYLSSVNNSNFESGNILSKTNGEYDWNQISAMPTNSKHRIIDTTSSLEMLGYTHLGGDGSEGSKALWLGAKDAITPEGKEIGYYSSPLTINKFGYYKISVNAKVDTNTTAKVKIVEGDDVVEFLKASGLREENITYTPVTKELTITSNPSNTTTNNFGTYSFYVKADSLFNTTVKVYLSLVSSNEESGLINGSVVFDNITVEGISSAEYDASATSSNTTKMDLSTITGTPSIANGTFNNVEVLKTENKFPLSPKNWEATVANSNENIYGVVNTQTDHYNANRALYYGNMTNPNNPSGISTDLESNNILMLWNKTNSYQSLTSSAFSVSQNTYYNITFKFKTTTPLANFNVRLVNQDGVKLFEKTNINSLGLWQDFNITLQVDKSSVTSLKIILGLGTEATPGQGHVFIDNVSLIALTNYTKEQFANEQISSENKNLQSTLDLSNNLLNSPIKTGLNSYEITAFTKKYEDGTVSNSTSARAGVINGQSNGRNISNSPNNTDSKYIYYIENDVTSHYSLTSIDSIELQTDKIYKFSVYMKTTLSSPAEGYTMKYGANFSLTGLSEKIENINTLNEWEEIVIIVRTTTATNVSLKVGLNTQTATSGVVYADNFKITDLTTEEYQTYVKEFEKEENSNLLIIGSTDIEEEPEENEETPNNFNWLIIPSLLTAVALILAIVGTILRRVNFKKFAKKKKTEYDRNQTLYRDIIRKEAEEKRDEELKELNETLNQLNLQLEEIELQNKERLSLQRKNKGKEIDKSMEKEFKAYATKHTKLEKQKELVLNQISNKNTAEYLLSLQKKLKEIKFKESLKK